MQQLSSCGKCSKIHLTAFWELSSFQTDCICATFTPFFLHKQRFSPPLIFIIWIRILPLQCLEILSNFLHLMSAQKCWEVGAEQFQRLRSKDSPGTAPSSIFQGGHAGTPCSAEELRKPAEPGRMQGRVTNGWRDVGTSLNQENSHQAMENVPQVESQPLEIFHTCLVRT